MSALRAKVFRDLLTQPYRALGVVVAIAIGLAAFAAVLYAYAILTRALNEGYLATNPASATIFCDRIDDQLVAAAAKRAGVADVQARRSVRGRIRVGPAEWRGLRLFVMPDFADLRISTIAPQEGAWPPGRGEVLVERDALQVARSAIGDDIIVKLDGGTEHTLHVTGTVKDVGQAQARMERMVYGYVTRETIAQLGAESGLDQLKLTVATNAFDRTHIERVASDLSEWLRSQGRTVNGVDIPDPGKHPHETLMALLLLIMAAFGFLALLLSGFLVVNLLRALLAAQARQIAIMQAIGGTRSQIALIYLSQAMLLGGAAFVLATPIAYLGGFALCRYLAELLNFDITSYAVPLWVHALQFTAAILVPLASAAIPVLRGTRVPIRLALTDYGLPARAFGTTRLERALSRLRLLPLPLALAARNALRSRGRLVLTITTLTIAGLFFMTAPNVRTSLIESLDRSLAARKYDLAIVLGDFASLDQVREAIAALPEVGAVEGWIVSSARDPGAGAGEGERSGDATPNDAQDTHDHGSMSQREHGERQLAFPQREFAVTAIPPRSQLLDLDIAAGRGLRAGDSDSVVINSRLAASLQARPGDALSFQIGPLRRTWHIVGISREPFFPSAGYVSLEAWEQADHGRLTNSIRIELNARDRAAFNAAREAIEHALEERGIRVKNFSGAQDDRDVIYQHFLMIYNFLVIMAAVLGLVGGLGLSTTVALSVLERQRELAVMLAIGGTPAVLWLVVVVESVFIAIASALLALVLSWPVLAAVLTFRAIRLQMHFEPAGPIIWIAISVALGVVASFVPAWRATRMTIRQALTQAA